MSGKSMQFLFGDRELVINSRDLLDAPVDVIVNSANNDLSHHAGLAARILELGGEKVRQECSMLLQQYDSIDSGMAVYTTAGDLPFKSVIHVVGPRMGEGQEQQKLEQSIARCLQLCEINEWHSIAFPAISAGLSNVPIDICAQGFFRSITHFWDARLECALDRIELCLSSANLMAFISAFREDALQDNSVDISPETTEKEVVIGYVELTEDDIANSNDDEINDWFNN